MIQSVKKIIATLLTIQFVFSPLVTGLALATTVPTSAELLAQIQTQASQATAQLPSPSSSQTTSNTSASQTQSAILAQTSAIAQSAQSTIQQAVNSAFTDNTTASAPTVNTTPTTPPPTYTNEGPINAQTGTQDSTTNTATNNTENKGLGLVTVVDDDAQTLQNNNIDPVQTAAGDKQISGGMNVGDTDGVVTLNTGAVKIQGDVFNQANTNSVSVNQTHHSDTTIENQNKNQITNLFDYFGSSGQNSVDHNDGRAEIDTGNVDIRLNMMNLANTNLSNSTWGQYFYNSDKPVNGDIDIQDMWHKASHDDCRFGECAGEFKVVNVNDSAIQNKVKVLGISGQNKIKDADGNGVIRTGDVRVSANLINFVNTNLTGSDWDLSVINIFDQWKGDLILPGKQSYDSNRKNFNIFPNTNIDNTNDISIANDVQLDAQTGENVTANNDGDVDITTGDALSKSNIQNIVNANFHGGDWFLVLINRFNKWDGSVHNKPLEIGIANKDNSVILSSFLSDEMLQSMAHRDDDAVLSTTNTNLGSLRNEILIQALTGGNEITDNDGKALIETGKALILSNILNIANVNITGGDWHLAVVNVFGDWTGNVLFGKPDLKLNATANKSELKQPGETVDVEVTYSNTGTTDSESTQLQVAYDNENLKPTGQASVTTATASASAANSNSGSLSIPLGNITQGSTKKITQRFEYTGKNKAKNPIKVSFALQSSVPDLNTTDNSQELTFKNNSTTANTPNTPPTATSTTPTATSTPPTQNNNTQNNATSTTPNNNQNSNQQNSNTQNNTNTGANNGSASAAPVATQSTDKSGPIELTKANNTKGKVAPGQKVLYTITVKNVSDNTVYGLTVKDVMKDAQGKVISQDSWDFEELKGKKGFEIKYDIVVPNSIPSGTYTNFAEISGLDAKGVKFTAKAKSAIVLANATLDAQTAKKETAPQNAQQLAAAISTTTTSVVATASTTPPTKNTLQSKTATSTITVAQAKNTQPPATLSGDFSALTLGMTALGGSSNTSKKSASNQGSPKTIAQKSKAQITAEIEQIHAPAPLEYETSFMNKVMVAIDSGMTAIRNSFPQIMIIAILFAYCKAFPPLHQSRRRRRT